MNLRLSWLDGGEAEVIETDGDRVVVLSSRPAAAGQPLVAAAQLVSAARFRLKVQGCKRQDGGWYRITGRWLDLTRAMRQEIVQRSQGPVETGS